MNRKLKVLIVDDSKTVCRILSTVFSKDPDLEVVGTALSAYEAREKIKALSPEVLTLDIEMPGMDGVTFLRNLMRLKPMPVVMFSSLTKVGAQATLDALDAGAVDFMHKIPSGDGVDMEQYMSELKDKVKVAGRVKLGVGTLGSEVVNLPDLSDCHSKLRANKLATPGNFDYLLAIGASTGGPQAIDKVLRDLDAKNCALVISQHMPEQLVESFIQRLNRVSAFDIRMATHGEKIEIGHGYLSPGDRHLAASRRVDGLYWELLDTPKVSGHRPSVNVLFDSLAETAAIQTIALLLTGMGDDGAMGLKKIRNKGGVTLAQNEESSIVWGMPGRAAEFDAVDCTVDLSQAGSVLNQLVN